MNMELDAKKSVRDKLISLVEGKEYDNLCRIVQETDKSELEDTQIHEMINLIEVYAKEEAFYQEYHSEIFALNTWEEMHREYHHLKMVMTGIKLQRGEAGIEEVKEKIRTGRISRELIRKIEKTMEDSDRSSGNILFEEDDNPLVSIIMPCYNHQKYVGQAIESVLNQTYGNIEFIVGDNGSTDASYEVIRGYGGKIQKVFHIDENDGNVCGYKLRERCTGQYIAFMTSDDFWEEDKLEIQMQALKQNPQVKACFTWANEADENLNLQGEKKIFKEKNRSRYEWIRRVLVKGNCFAYPSAVIDWDVYYEAFCKLTLFRQLSDLYLWLLILMKYEVYVVEKPLVWFRWHTRGANCNLSAENRDSIVRTRNETAIIAEEVISQMQDDVFRNVFWDCLRDKNAITEEEIWCEKFFVLMLFAQLNKDYEQAVIDYYYKKCYPIDGDYRFIRVLREKYHYTIEDIRTYSASHGIGNMAKEIEDFKKERERSARKDAYIACLYEVLNSEADVSARRCTWRRKVFGILPAELKELSMLLQRELELMSREGTGGYVCVLQILKEMQISFLYVWDEFLSWDREIRQEEWNAYVAAIGRSSITEAEYSTTVFLFIRKVADILREYSIDGAGAKL